MRFVFETNQEAVAFLKASTIKETDSRLQSSPALNYVLEEVQQYEYLDPSAMAEFELALQGLVVERERMLKNMKRAFPVKKKGKR